MGFITKLIKIIKEKCMPRTPRTRTYTLSEAIAIERQYREEQARQVLLLQQHVDFQQYDQQQYGQQQINIQSLPGQAGQVFGINSTGYGQWSAPQYQTQYTYTTPSPNPTYADLTDYAHLMNRMYQDSAVFGTAYVKVSYRDTQPPVRKCKLNLPDWF